MFSEFVEIGAGGAGRTKWAIAVSAMLQIVVLLVLVLMPLLYTEALTGFVLNFRRLVDAPVPLVDALKPPETHAQAQVLRAPKRLFVGGVLYAPTSFPAKPLIFQEAPLPPELSADSRDYGAADLFNFGTDARTDVLAPVAPPVIQRIRQSEIQQAMILAQPQPVYPPLALIARIQGDVVLHAIIDREGRVAELQVVSGHPVLVQAALAAVRGWRYRPTLLSGEPVEVETTITVSFVLGR